MEKSARLFRQIMSLILSIIKLHMKSEIKDFTNQPLAAILQGQKPIQDSIAYIIQQIAAQNMQQTFSSISTIYTIFKDHQQSSQIYIRSLQAIKLIVQTCSYSAVLLVEVYILPILAKKVNQRAESDIFSHKSSSFSRVSQKRQLKSGFSFKSAIIELIILAAHIKPFRIAVSSQLSQKSDFQIEKQSLQTHQITKLTLTLQKYEKLRSRFISNIQDLSVNGQKHSSFLLKKWAEFNQHKNAQQHIDIQTLFFSGEYYLISSFMQSFHSFLKNQDNFQEKIQYKYIKLLTELLRKGFIETIAFIIDKDITFLISKRISDLGKNLKGKTLPEMMNTYQEVQTFRKGVIKVLNCQEIAVDELYDLMSNRTSDIQKNISSQTLQALGKNNLRNMKIALYLTSICHKPKISVQDQIPFKDQDVDQQQNIQTVRIDDYQVQELSEFYRQKNKKQKHLGSRKIYSSKMSSKLSPLRQSLSSRHSRDSKLSGSSLGKAVGIKLYSQLKNKKQQKSQFEMNSSQQSLQQSTHKPNNPSIILDSNSIAAISQKKQQGLMLPKDNQQKSSYLEENSQTDFIETPDLIPQRNSYYKVNDENSVLKNNDVISFKAALQEKQYQGIDARQKELCLIHQSSGFKNVVKSPKFGSRSSKQSEYLPTNSSKVSKFNRQDVVLSSKNQSFLTSKADKLSLKEEKDQMTLLEEKLKRLQKQKLIMRTQLAIKSNELGNLKSSSVFGSQKNLALYQTPSDSQIFPNRQSREKILKSLKFRKQEDSEFEKEIQAKYQPFFDKFKGNTGKKNLLRSKCLVQNSQELQFGLLSQLRQDQAQSEATLLQLTLFFTFHKFDALEFSCSFVENSAFKFTAQTNKRLNFKMKKQQKVYATLRLLSIPFHLPQLQISYKADSQYIVKNLKLTLPLSFNKFVKISHFQFKKDVEPNGECLRTNIFQFNVKNIPVDKILQYLPGWSVINQEKKGQLLCMGVVCKFENTKFNVILKLTEKGCIIQGYLLVGEAKTVELYVCTLKNIFELQKK